MADENISSETPTKKAVNSILRREGSDVDWRAKITVAKKAKKAAEEARRGKPLSFKTHLFGSR